MSDYSKENYHAPGEEFYLNHFQFTEIFERYKNKIIGNIVDFGCNSGGQTIAISKLKTINSITGIDINESALNSLKELKISNITCIHSNLTSLPINTDSFDNGYSFHTLEHIYNEDLKSVINEMYRVLKPMAYLLINIPYMDAYPSNQHAVKFDENNLRIGFEKSGFETVEILQDLNNTLTLLARTIK